MKAIDLSEETAFNEITRKERPFIGRDKNASSLERIVDFETIAPEILEIRTGSFVAGRYKLVSPLNQGGMGIVWRALDKVLGRQVAIKFLKINSDPELAESFLEEARITARFSHPHIVTVFEMGHHEKIPFIVFELLSGKTLGQLLRNSLPLTQIIDLIIPVAHALVRIHERGIVHCDLKPDNISVSESMVKVIDFGIAIAVRNAVKSGRIVGTPAYMSPEQLVGRCNIDERSDIFSICMLMYKAITGKLPYAEANTKQLVESMLRFDEPVPSLKNVVSGIPEAIAEIVDWGLQKKKENRLPNAAILIKSLEKFKSRNSYFQLFYPEVAMLHAGQSIAQCTVEKYNNAFAGRHLLHGIVEKWAKIKPDSTALVDVNTEEEISWKQFNSITTMFALELHKMGFRKGDFFATVLPCFAEHVFLEYACFKLGVVFAPLDLRLKSAEITRSIRLIEAKGLALSGQTNAASNQELKRVIKEQCPSVQHIIQFSTLKNSKDYIKELLRGEPICDAKKASSKDDLINEAISFNTFASQAMANNAALSELTASITKDDGALVVFTTGSTGYPKPALLSHCNITCQNMCLIHGFLEIENPRMLVNAPPSHVMGQTGQLMTPLFAGGSVVLLPVFDPAESLAAIEKYAVNIIGQIPTQFNLEWRLPNYHRYDLSSLSLAICAGQSASRRFFDKLSTMASQFGTGLALTETAGVCTYLMPDGVTDNLRTSVGFDSPIYSLSIREPMKDDGMAGDELPNGVAGHICFTGPQTFQGYVNDPVMTSKTISKDCFLYTGDIGFRDENGLHLAGRAKWIIKPKGYQVFPGQVEEHFCLLDNKVASCAVVGVAHSIFIEAIVAFIEKKLEITLSVAELEQHAQSIASYMRPLHYVILNQGELPLNRLGKTDYVRLSEMARQEVNKLGTWDLPNVLAT